MNTRMLVATFVVGWALIGCSDGSEKLGVSEKRFEQWSEETDLPRPRQQAVKRLLQTATRSRQVAKEIPDSARRAAVLRRVDREVALVLSTLDGNGTELFEEAGFQGVAQ